MTVEKPFDKLYVSKIMGRGIDTSVSFLSELCHFVTLKLRKKRMQLESGMLIISVDIDVGSKELGIINEGRDDVNVSRGFGEYLIGEIEERSFPIFIDLFNSLDIPATFAIRGQLTEVDSPILPSLLESSIGHDIGAHGYYHRQFQQLSDSEAENELEQISIGMKKFNIIPRSFVFPRNSVCHLNVLEKYGYECYRSYGDFLVDCMHIEKYGRLYNIHPSLYIDKDRNPFFLKRILDVAIAKKLPFHVWMHLWNFGFTKESIQRTINRVFFSMLKYAKKKEKDGLLTFETMLSAARKLDAGV